MVRCRHYRCRFTMMPTLSLAIPGIRMRNHTLRRNRRIWELRMSMMYGARSLAIVRAITWIG